MSGKTASARPSFFRRALYCSYGWGAGLRHFIGRRLRPAGIALLVVFLLGGVLGAGHPRDPVYQLFSLAFGMGLIALPWSLLRRAKLSAVRELPRHATAGEPVRYTVTVQNLGSRRLARAYLSESAPDPRPDLVSFTRLREPGEEERNWFDRALSYYRWQWLISQRELFAGGTGSSELQLAPHTGGRVTLELTPRRRGVIPLQDLRVLLPDGFGLFQGCRKIPAPPAAITVLPKRYALPPLELPGSTRFQIGGDSATNLIGNAGEFVGLREYRPGDPLRQIHWKSWARTGRPIVKELEDTFYPRYGLVLDTFPVAGTGRQFEDAVSVAASFAAAIDTQESLLDLIFIKDQAHIITAGRGVERTDKLLEVLAAVEADGEEQFDALARIILQHRDELTSCILVLCGWDSHRAQFLQTLQRSGVTCAPLIVGYGPAPAHVPGHWLESGHLARDLMKLPAQLGSLS